MTSETLETLLAAHDEPCVSIYLPTHRVWSDTPQDKVRLKNLLTQAEERLVQAGTRTAAAQDLLRPVRNLLDGAAPFWRNQGDGLAIFLARDAFLSYRLPLRFDEEVVVNDRFYVKPLLELFTGDGLFYVLALNLGGVHLLRGTRFGLSELDLPNVPTNLDAFLRFDDFESHQQFHSGSTRTNRGERGAIFHGQGDAADEANMKKHIVEFFRQVDNGVRKALSERPGPLVPAGLDHLRGLYRSVNHYPHLLREGIDVNPGDLSREALHDRAWRLVEPRFSRARQEALDAYRRLSTTEPDRTSDRIQAIVPAAYFKRVDVLFVDRSAHIRGTFDPERQQVEVHDERRPGDEDLLNLAVVHTLLNGGVAYLFDRESLPDLSEAAAVFRYA